MPFPINLANAVRQVDGGLQLSSGLDANQAKALLKEIKVSLRDEKGVVRKGELTLNLRSDGGYELNLANYDRGGKEAANARPVIEQLLKRSIGSLDAASAAALETLLDQYLSGGGEKDKAVDPMQLGQLLKTMKSITVETRPLSRPNSNWSAGIDAGLGAYAGGTAPAHSNSSGNPHERSVDLPTPTPIHTPPRNRPAATGTSQKGAETSVRRKRTTGSYIRSRVNVMPLLWTAINNWTRQSVDHEAAGRIMKNIMTSRIRDDAKDYLNFNLVGSQDEVPRDILRLIGELNLGSAIDWTCSDIDREVQHQHHAFLLKASIEFWAMGNPVLEEIAYQIIDAVDAAVRAGVGRPGKATVDLTGKRNGLIPPPKLISKFKNWARTGNITLTILTPSQGRRNIPLPDRSVAAASSGSTASGGRRGGPFARRAVVNADQGAKTSSTTARANSGEASAIATELNSKYMDRDMQELLDESSAQASHPTNFEPVIAQSAAQIPDIASSGLRGAKNDKARAVVTQRLTPLAESLQTIINDSLQKSQNFDRDLVGASIISDAVWRWVNKPIISHVPILNLSKYQSTIGELPVEIWPRLNDFRIAMGCRDIELIGRRSKNASNGDTKSIRLSALVEKYSRPPSPTARNITNAGQGTPMPFAPVQDSSLGDRLNNTNTLQNTNVTNALQDRVTGFGPADQATSITRKPRRDKRNIPLPDRSVAATSGGSTASGGRRGIASAQRIVVNADQGATTSSTTAQANSGEASTLATEPYSEYQAMQDFIDELIASLPTNIPMPLPSSGSTASGGRRSDVSARGNLVNVDQGDMTSSTTAQANSGEAGTNIEPLIAQPAARLPRNGTKYAKERAIVGQRLTPLAESLQTFIVDLVKKSPNLDRNLEGAARSISKALSKWARAPAIVSVPSLNLSSYPSAISKLPMEIWPHLDNFRIEMECLDIKLIGSRSELGSRSDKILLSELLTNAGQGTTMPFAPIQDSSRGVRSNNTNASQSTNVTNAQQERTTRFGADQVRSTTPLINRNDSRKRTRQAFEAGRQLRSREMFGGAGSTTPSATGQVNSTGPTNHSLAIDVIIALDRIITDWTHQSRNFSRDRIGGDTILNALWHCTGSPPNNHILIIDMSDYAGSTNDLPVEILPLLEKFGALMGLTSIHVRDWMIPIPNSRPA